MHAFHHHTIDEGRYDGIAELKRRLRGVVPIFLKDALLIDLLTITLIIEVKGVLPDQQLVHDDSQRKDIILRIKILAVNIVFGCAVGHRQAGLMIYIARDILFILG